MSYAIVFIDSFQRTPFTLALSGPSAASVRMPLPANAVSSRRKRLRFPLGAQRKGRKLREGSQMKSFANKSTPCSTISAGDTRSRDSAFRRNSALVRNASMQSTKSRITLGP